MVLKINNNEIHLYGNIWDGDGAYFLEQFTLLDNQYPTIEVFLHCYGGTVFDGNMMFNAMINATSTVNTNIIGIAASMGALLSQAGAKRRQVSNGFMMIHQASGYTYGGYKDHLNNANLLKEIGKQFKQILVKKTEKPIKEVEKWLVGDNWFSAEQALEAGLIDEIIDPLATLDIDIEDPAAIGGQEIYSRFAASLHIEDVPPPFMSLPKSTLKTPKQKTNTNITMEQSSIDLLGLTGITPQSSETALVQAIQNRFTNLQNTIDQEKSARQNLESAVNAQKKAKITALIEGVDGLSAKQKELYAKIGQDSGIEALETVLNNVQPRTSIAQIIQKPGTTTGTPEIRAGWDWDKYQEEDPRALETMQQNDLENFSALFTAKFGTEYKPN